MVNKSQRAWTTKAGQESLLRRGLKTWGTAQHLFPFWFAKSFRSRIFP